MDNFENLEEIQAGVLGWASKNMYFVALVLVIAVFLLYKLISSNIHLAEILDTNFIEQINNFLGKTWLSSKMEGGAIKVEMDENPGLLDNIMEELHGMAV
jgi:hypothetical protein